MNEFKENTHIVIKREDVDKYLTITEKVLLDNILSSISIGRAREGKNQNNTYYICNTDEPYAEKVLNIILNQGAAGDWILCSERLPECYLVRDIFKRPNKWQTNIVLVTVKSTECDGVHYYVGQDYMVGSSKENVSWLMSCGYGGSAVYEQEIIAWQPRPEVYQPPAAVEEEE